MESTDMTWRKSSYSNGGADACVEVGAGHQGVMIRDTQARELGHIAVPAGAWSEFINTIK